MKVNQLETNVVIATDTNTHAFTLRFQHNLNIKHNITSDSGTKTIYVKPTRTESM